MSITKYGFEIDSATVIANVNRLTNQLWKLIPMREHQENWLGQLNTVIIELTGLNEIFAQDSKNFIILLSKLEGLKNLEVEFEIYRKTVFETISLLREIQI